jgi:hypothetical protein
MRPETKTNLRRWASRSRSRRDEDDSLRSVSESAAIPTLRGTCRPPPSWDPATTEVP